MKGEFDFLYNGIGQGLFIVTRHPRVIGRGHRLPLLEGIIEHGKDKPSVYFATIIDYCRKWKNGKTPSLSPELFQGWFRTRWCTFLYIPSVRTDLYAL
jgi:peptidoglycan-N-acetylglucosamine deacetylase